MARGIHTRLASRSVLGKRRRSGYSGGPFKRRRFQRRNRSKAFTSQSGVGSGFRFIARRKPRRVWNRMLWNSTLQKSHFRSIAATSVSGLLIAGPNTSTVGWQTALRITSNFWTLGGGAQQLDSGTAPPSFDGDIILRGGMVNIKLVNLDPDTQGIQGEVFLIRTGDDFESGSMPATVPITWDPSVIPDFKGRIGRIIFRRKFLLENNAIGDFSCRLRIQKIDQTEYMANENTYIWIYKVNGTQNANATVTVTWGFNISFSGDAI